MGKLVRDRIPEIIRQSGRTSHVTTVDEQTYRKALHDKLLEEAAELRVAQRRGHRRVRRRLRGRRRARRNV